MLHVPMEDDKEDQMRENEENNDEMREDPPAAYPYYQQKVLHAVCMVVNREMGARFRIKSA